MSVCPSVLRLSLGAYVVGSLSPTERAEVEAHLARCPACREELAELAGLPGLLARVPVTDRTAGEPMPSPRMLERLLGEVARRRRAQRRRRALAALAAACALTGAVIAASLPGGMPEDGGSGATQVLAARHPRSGVLARLALRREAWGTAIGVRLRGVPPHERCELVAVARDGRRDVAGSWRASYDGEADVTGATAIPRAQLRSVEVVDGAGRRLVATKVGNDARGQ